MAWVLEAKGYHCDEDKKFTAIIPSWSGYSRHYYLRPVNHIITGKAVRIERFNDREAPWHPDNCYSEEKWIEVILKLCHWELNGRGEYIIDRCKYLTYPNHLQSCKSPLWKFYVPAIQLQKIANDITYKSKDREIEEAEYYIEAWNNMRSCLAE